MRRHDEMRLRAAVQTLQGDAPEAAQLDAAAKRVAGRLGIDVMDDSAVDIIENCGDVQKLLGSYRAGTLSGARRLLIEDHLRDCGACLRRFRSGQAAVLDWSTPCGKRCICLALASIRLSNSCLFRTSGLLLLRLQSLLADPAGSPSRSAIDRWLRVWHFRCRRSPTFRRRPAKGRRTVPDQWRRACRSSALRWIHR